MTLQRSWHNPANIPTFVTEPYRAALRQPDWDDAFIAMAKVDLPPNYKKALSQINCPVLVLYGDDDLLGHIEESHNMYNAIKHTTHAEFLKLHSCGHMPHEEIPRRFVNAVSEFVARHREGGLVGNFSQLEDKEQKERTFISMQESQPTTAHEVEIEIKEGIQHFVLGCGG